MVECIRFATYIVVYTLVETYWFLSFVCAAGSLFGVGINHAWGLSMAWRVRVSAYGARVEFTVCVQVFVVFSSLGLILFRESGVSGGARVCARVGVVTVLEMERRCGRVPGRQGGACSFCQEEAAGVQARGGCRLRA
jgi:hypothetical protein